MPWSEEGIRAGKGSGPSPESVADTVSGWGWNMRVLLVMGQWLNAAPSWVIPELGDVDTDCTLGGRRFAANCSVLGAFAVRNKEGTHSYHRMGHTWVHDQKGSSAGDNDASHHQEDSEPSHNSFEAVLRRGEHCYGIPPVRLEAEAMYSTH